MGAGAGREAEGAQLVVQGGTVPPLGAGGHPAAATAAETASCRPHLRWAFDDPNVIIAMVVFVVVAVTVSALVDSAARRRAEAARACAEATALGRLATVVLTSSDPLPRLLHGLRAVFDLEAVAILRGGDDDDWLVEHAVGSSVPHRPVDATDALAIGPNRYLALVGSRTPAEDSRVLAAFAAQPAVAVDRRGAGEPT